MRFHSAVTDEESSREAAARLIAEASGAMGDRVDVAFLFLSPHHLQDAEQVVEDVWLKLDLEALIGCSAGGVIGGDEEVEQRPGMALLVGDLPGVRVHPFHIAGRSEWEEMIGDEHALAERIGHGPETRCVIGFGDPFTSPAGQLLTAFENAAPGVPLVGGMASGSRVAGGNVLIHNDRLHDEGFVGLSLAGPLRVETVVSQGCRPIGRPMIVTKSHANVVEQLGGRPALVALRETLNAISAKEEDLLRQGLFLGQAISEYREQFGRGDYLVRNVIGLDEQNGSIAISDYVKTGRTAQFHVRDAETAGEDLSLMLQSQGERGDPAAGGLLFSCNGRGLHMFDQPCHDIRMARAAMPRTPLAGFFAAGEFGPVGRRNFLHGHTASFALFRPEKG